MSFDTQFGMTTSNPGFANSPILICLLGEFQILKAGQAITVLGDKTKRLLSELALRPKYRARRETILQALWPEVESTLAGRSLNTLIYRLRKLLSDAIGNAMPVVHADNDYWINVEAGIDVDVARFEALVAAGEKHARAGNRHEANSSYINALHLYRGNLSATSDVHALVEAERLLTLYLTVLARQADYYFSTTDYSDCLQYALRLLSSDPFREDAHRIVMRCYVRQGERGQALRQYRFCEQLLLTEFNAAPELATRELFDQVRLEPHRV